MSGPGVRRSSFGRPSLVRRLILLAAAWSLAVLVVAGLSLSAFFDHAATARFDDELSDNIDELLAGTSTEAGHIAAPTLTDPRALRVYSGDYWEIATPNEAGAARGGALALPVGPNPAAAARGPRRPGHGRRQAALLRQRRSRGAAVARRRAAGTIAGDQDAGGVHGSPGPVARGSGCSHLRHRRHRRAGAPGRGPDRRGDPPGSHRAAAALRPAARSGRGPHRALGARRGRLSHRARAAGVGTQRADGPQSGGGGAPAHARRQPGACAPARPCR